MTIVEQCRYLETVYDTDFTGEILTSPVSWRQMQKRIQLWRNMSGNINIRLIFNVPLFWPRRVANINAAYWSLGTYKTPSPSTERRGLSMLFTIVCLFVWFYVIFVVTLFFYLHAFLVTLVFPAFLSCLCLNSLCYLCFCTCH